MPIRIFHGVSRIRESLLKRRPLDSPALGDETRARLRKAYGTDIGPEEFVERVFQKVAAHGDKEVL